MSYVQVFRQPHVMWLWGSQLFSSIGDHLFWVALSWMAIEKGGRYAALVLAAGSLVSLACTLLGGVYSDRWDRKRTMISVDILRAMAAGILPLLAMQDNVSLWTLALVVVVMGALGPFFEPALQASLPGMCREGTLQAANALLDSTRRLARVLGPSLSGALLLVVTLPDFFTMDAITYLVSALVLSRLRFPAVTAKQAPLSTDFRAAFRLWWEHPLLKWGLLSLGVVNLAWSAAYQVGVPLFLQQVLHEQAGALGLISGAYGLGNVASLLLVGGSARLNGFRMMFVGHVLLGAGFWIVSTADSLGMALCGVVIGAFGSPMGDLKLLTMIQTDFPPEHVGKMYSIRMFIGGAGLALGSLVAVPLYAVASISGGIALCAGLIAAVGLLGLVRFRGQKTSTP